jgi:hypothetical protein
MQEAALSSADSTPKIRSEDSLFFLKKHIDTGLEHDYDDLHAEVP